MTKRMLLLWLRRIVLALVGVAVFFFWLLHQIPTGGDADIAQSIARAISAGYGKFENPSKADRTHRGKIFYIRPGPRGNPTVEFYEVTTSDDMATIEMLAREAISVTSGAKSVTLEFYERQNWHEDRNSGSRGPEHLLRRIKVKKS